MNTPKLIGMFVGLASAVLAAEVGVTPVPDAVRAQFHLSPFYVKYVGIDGLPIVGSAKVSDYALLEARYLVEHMIGHRPEVIAAMARNNVRLVVMAPTEFTTDVPEHSDLTPKDHWDVRARGLGATAARPAVSCAEENLLAYRGDPYPAENVLIHEFGHTIHERGLSLVDPSFDGRLRGAYEAARQSGLWKNTYAGTNYREYWAVGVQCWFDCARENDADHNWVNTRAEVKTYDHQLAALLAEVFGDREWRYVLPAKRSPPSSHLAGFEVAKAPRFIWPVRLAQARGVSPGDAEDAAEADTPTVQLLAPDARPAWHSVGGGQATKVVFANATAGVVTIDWMDFQGRPRTYFTLPPGGKAEAATYAGHVWRARDTRGRILDFIVAGAQAGMAEIRDGGGQ